MVIFKLKFLDTDNKNCVRHFTWNFIFKCTAFGLHYNPVRYYLHFKEEKTGSENLNDLATIYTASKW